MVYKVLDYLNVKNDLNVYVRMTKSFNVFISIMRLLYSLATPGITQVFSDMNQSTYDSILIKDSLYP